MFNIRCLQSINGILAEQNIAVNQFIAPDYVLLSLCQRYSVGPFAQQPEAGPS